MGCGQGKCFDSGKESCAGGPSGCCPAPVRLPSDRRVPTAGGVACGFFALFSNFFPAVVRCGCRAGLAAGVRAHRFLLFAGREGRRRVRRSSRRSMRFAESEGGVPFNKYEASRFIFVLGAAAALLGCARRKPLECELPVAHRFRKDVGVSLSRRIAECPAESFYTEARFRPAGRNRAKTTDGTKLG